MEKLKRSIKRSWYRWLMKLFRKLACGLYRQYAGWKDEFRDNVSLHDPCRKHLIQARTYILAKLRECRA